MSVSYFESLLAQAASPPIAPVILILGGIAAFLGFLAVYLLCVPMRMMRGSIADGQQERDKLTANLEQQRVQADKDLHEAKLAAASQRDEERRAAEMKIEDRDRHIRRLQREAEAHAELPAIKSKLCDAQLANHVGRRAQQRLEEKVVERAVAARSELQLVNAELRSAEARSQQLDRQIRHDSLDQHVQRRLQQRLEQRIQDQADQLQNSSRKLAELTARAESLEGSLRTQSETAIQKKLEEVERQGDTLRRLQGQLQSSDLPPQACIEALASLANGRASEGGHPS